MLKHRAVTQFRVADAETQSCYSCSPESQMLKHRAVTQSRVADAETQRKPLHNPGPMMLKHKGSRYTVSGQQQPYIAPT
jgi:hypothetical protein